MISIPGSIKEEAPTEPGLPRILDFTEYTLFLRYLIADRKVKGTPVSF